MQFDLFTGKSRKSSCSASFGDWLADGLVAARRFLPYGELMGEEFKKLPIAQPGHPNWWGWLVSAAADAKIIRRTDRFQKSESRRNHGHH
jgi:hypothetical protein